MSTLFPVPPIRTTHPEQTHSQWKGQAWRSDVPGGTLLYQPQFLPTPQADALLREMLATQRPIPDLVAQLQTHPNQIDWKHIAWQQTPIRIFGKEVMQPRLTAWYGDPGASYTYSGTAHSPIPWAGLLLPIKKAVESAAQTTFNSVLLNAYRNGQDSMGWHADDEPELGPNPIIASLNLGQTRRFILRHRQNHAFKLEYALGHGDLLIMAGALQHHWQHAVPKEKHADQLRINFTFRRIYP